MRVAIIGAGALGATAALRIAEAELADVVLVDIVASKAEAVALDLNSAASIMRHSRRITGTTDIQEIAGADIVVLSAGQTRKPGQSRDDLLHSNAKIIKDLAQKIAKHCLDSVVIVVTNPVDAMSYLVYKTTGFPANQIIGMGGVSDCARFNLLIAKELNTASQHVQSVIIGAHADTMVILPRFSTVLGIPVTELLPADRIKRIVEQTRNFGAKIVELLGQGSAYYGPSAGVFQLVDAIIHDRKPILCASTYLSGQYGLKDLSIGVPIKIGRMGVEEIIELKLAEEEKQAFQASAGSVKDAIKKLGV